MPSHVALTCQGAQDDRPAVYAMAQASLGLGLAPLRPLGLPQLQHQLSSHSDPGSLSPRVGQPVASLLSSSRGTGRGSEELQPGHRLHLPARLLESGRALRSVVSVNIPAGQLDAAAAGENTLLLWPAIPHAT